MKRVSLALEAHTFDIAGNTVSVVLTAPHPVKNAATVIRMNELRVIKLTSLQDVQVSLVRRGLSGVMVS